MGKKSEQESAGIAAVLFKGFLAGALITGAAILILSLLLYKTSLSENILHIAVIAVYAISCFLSGLYCGRKIKERRFLWGLLAGCIYYVVLLAVSLIVSNDGFSASFVSSALVCLGSGMLGGMLS